MTHRTTEGYFTSIMSPTPNLFLRLFLFVFIGLLSGSRGNAIIRDPPDWWEPFEDSWQSTFPIDVNGDGVMDINATAYGSFDRAFVSSSDCCYISVDVYWQIDPLGETQLLVSGGATSSLLRLESGRAIVDAARPGERWSSETQPLGRLVARYDSYSAPIISTNSGPFANDAGFIGVKFTTLDGPALGWISMPKGLESLFGRPPYAPTNHQPACSFAVIGVAPITTGQVVPSNDAGNRRLIPSDVDRDGLPDFAVEQYWSSAPEEFGQLLQVSIKGLRGAQLLTAIDPAKGFSESSYARHQEYSADGLVTGSAEESLRLAKVVPRQLLVPQGTQSTEWSETGQWAVLWQHDLETFQELGPLSEGSQVLIGGKLPGQKCGWLRLGTPDGKLEWGAFTGFEAMAAGETNKAWRVVQRYDLNRDGLVDALYLGSADTTFPECGKREALAVEEPDLIPLRLSPTINLGTNVALGTQIPAERDLFMPEPWMSPGPPTGIAILRYQGCYYDFLGFTGFAEEFSISTNFIPVRIRGDDGWHSGWIGYRGGQLQASVHPTAGEPSLAGVVENPGHSVPFRIEATEDALVFSWGSYLVKPKVMRQRLGKGTWESVPDYESWSTGLKLKLEPNDAGSFFRLDY